MSGRGQLQGGSDWCWWGCSVRGAWEAADRCYDQQPTSENLIDQAHTFGCRSRAQAELSTLKHVLQVAKV